VLNGRCVAPGLPPPGRWRPGPSSPPAKRATTTTSTTMTIATIPETLTQRGIEGGLRSGEPRRCHVSDLLSRADSLADSLRDNMTLIKHDVAKSTLRILC
jgi:hypothetical protein